MIENRFEYDAFISYRHIPRDMEVAKKLHTELENYRTPKKLVKIGFPKRLNRVFRDREELPASSDLSSDIIEALKSSRYLIVICSPEAVLSEWVLKEVEIFIGFHGHDKLITLLVEGEPKDAFPPGIIRYLYSEDGTIESIIEPLAADIRRRDGKQPFSLLKEEKLRLIATIIGCKFDDLRQREHERKIKKIVTATLAIGLALAVFALTFLILFIQVNEAKNLAQKNKSSLLTYVSEMQTQNGDRINAMLLALEAYKSNGMKNTTFDIEKALYRTAMAKNYQSKTIVTNSGKIDKGCLSKDESYLLIDTAGGGVNIYDSKTGELIENFNGRNFHRNIFSKESAYVYDIIPNSNNIIMKIKNSNSKKNQYILYDLIEKKEISILNKNVSDEDTFIYYDFIIRNKFLPIFCYSIYDTSDESLKNKKVYIANSLTGKPVASFDVPIDAYCTVLNENNIAVTTDNTLKIYNVHTGFQKLNNRFVGEKIVNVSACNSRYIAIYTSKKNLVVIDSFSGTSKISLSNVDTYNTAFDNKDGFTM